MNTLAIRTAYARYLWVFPGIVYLLSAYLILGEYLIADAGLMLGLVLSPYLFPVLKNKGVFSWRYLAPAVLCAALATYMDVLTLYYLALTFSVLFMLETLFGKTENEGLMLLLAMSPLFRYLVNTLGFPIRIELTSACAFLLNRVGFDVKALGNILVLDGREFAVDPACIGLNMVTVSLILGLFFIIYFKRRTGKDLPLISLFFILSAIVGFSVVNNLVRIILIVLFMIPADSLQHDIAGLVCLFAYVLVPAFFLTRFVFGKIRKSETGEHKAASPFFPIPVKNTVNLLLPVLIFSTGYSIDRGSNRLLQHASPMMVNGFSSELLNNGVLRLVNDSALIYVKPIRGFYAAEHSPAICWIGSGYRLMNVQTSVISGKTVYTGRLKKKEETLYASWWFDSGEHKTIRQLEWRWNMLKGNEKYVLVNVNAGTEKDLIKNTSLMLNQNLFTALWKLKN